jgi:indolepyruvate ferredoxin oxidoreductase
VRRAFSVLAKLKGLRGTALDPFGKTEERKTERALIDEYRACIEELLGGLTPEKLSLAVEIARLPEGIRGYGHVKERNLQAVRTKWQALMAQWRQAPAATKDATAAQRQVA